MKISELEKFDAAYFLNDEKDVFYYLKVVLEENDPSAIAEALNTISRSRQNISAKNLEIPNE